MSGMKNSLGGVIYQFSYDLTPYEMGSFGIDSLLGRINISYPVQW